MTLQNDIELIENLAQVDPEAKEFLEQLEIRLKSHLRCFALRKGITLSAPPEGLTGKCSDCGKVGFLSFYGLCPVCNTNRIDVQEGCISIQIKCASGGKAKIVSRQKACTIPDAYRRLGVIAYRNGCVRFKKSGPDKMWYENEEGATKYYVRFI